MSFDIKTNLLGFKSWTCSPPMFKSGREAIKNVKTLPIVYINSIYIEVYIKY